MLLDIHIILDMKQWKDSGKIIGLSLYTLTVDSNPFGLKSKVKCI